MGPSRWAMTNSLLTRAASRFAPRAPHSPALAIVVHLRTAVVDPFPASSRCASPLALAVAPAVALGLHLVAKSAEHVVEVPKPYPNPGPLDIRRSGFMQTHVACRVE
ncbi:hypothetical protein BS50DRAFT_567151 [Corynespora cassiicola Philippines]|uniref:Uncharacterized protein n=1 Tax=Corynespora cassiicola Philippines TaxID=1448308 RepID=A0A2T2PAA8_CORCC|nr:hypothetical protein BS50DRAFT_567151 [Corynespora cassiicola Philippines]